MSKKNITDFFKPFAYPRENKRPLSANQPEETRPSQRSRSITSSSELAKASVKQNDAFLTSSQSSLLSSLQTSTPRGIDDPPSQDHALPLRDFGDGHSVQSDASNGLEHQAPIFNSSQRIVRNGEVIIKDSDDERSDSDISLEDLEDLIAPRKRPLVPSSPPESGIPAPVPPVTTRSKTARSTRKGNPDSAPVAADRTPSISTALPRYKFSLDTLIKQSQNDVDARAKINNAKHLLEDLEEQKPISQGIDTPRIDEGLLAAVVRDRDGNGGTAIDDLKGAMERTEALYQDWIWSFFDPKQQHENIEPAVFPPIVDSYWRDLVEEPSTRQQAFLSGYIGECASLRKLPQELLVWLLDSACYEERDDLQNSYCQTLRACGDQVTSCLTISTFNKMFQRIGARPEALDFKIAALPRQGLRDHLQPDAHATLRRVLDVHLAVASLMSPQLRTHTLCVLSRLLLDRSVANDCRLVYTVEAIINTLLETMEGESNTYLSNAMMAVYSSVKDPGLQLQLLRHLPLSTFAQSLLRRRLALAFFFDDPKFFTKDSKSLIDLKIITRHLHKPQFSVSRQTDYAGFAALIGLLVIGLDNAEPPPIDAGREATAAFNADIDVLAERVKRLSTQILDTDAAHRKRTEAKEMVDTFHPCLLYGIRTQRQSKGMIWGDDAESEKQRSMMNGFFRKAKPVRRDLNGAE